MNEKKLLIIKTGSTLPSIKAESGDFEDWISKGLGRLKNEIKVIDAVLEPLPHPDQIKGIVISGSHEYVNDNMDWSLRLEDWYQRGGIVGRL